MNKLIVVDNIKSKNSSFDPYCIGEIGLQTGS